MNSGHLRDMVDGEVIPEWVAERLDLLSSEELKERAAERLKPAIREAIESLCNRLEHPGGEVLYDSRTMPVHPAPGAKAGFGAVLPARWPFVAELLGLLKESSAARWVLIMGALGLAPVLATNLYQGVSGSVRWAYSHLSSIMTARQPLHPEDVVTPKTAGNNGKGSTVPHITSYEYTTGHKLRLHWDSVGEGYTYKIYRSYGDTAPSVPLIGGPGVNTPGATINVDANGDTLINVAVQAVPPDGSDDSDLSRPVRFELRSISNKDNTVEPLALEPVDNGGGPQRREIRNSGMSATAAKGVPLKEHHSPPLRPSRPIGTPAVTDIRSSPPPKPGFLASFARHIISNADGAIQSAIPIAPVGEGVVAVKNAAMKARDEAASPPAPVAAATGGRPGEAAVPVPTGLRWNAEGNRFHLKWDPIGAGYQYNYYMSLVGQPKTREKESDQPLLIPEAWFTPNDHSLAFDVTVTAIDPQGRESLPSKILKGVKLP